MGLLEDCEDLPGDWLRASGLGIRVYNLLAILVHEMTWLTLRTIDTEMYGETF